MPLSLVPGITYRIVVRAPEMAAATVEHRPGVDGGDVPVGLVAGEALRIAVEGVTPGGRASVVTFPDFGRLDTTAREGAVEVEGVREGWVIVMAASRVLLVNAAGAAPRRAPVSGVFTVTTDGAARTGNRIFLIGLSPLADGVHPVGLVWAPLGIPEGRYVPVEWTREEIVIHAAVDLSASSPTWTRPADDDVEWTRGEHSGEGPARVVIEGAGARLPVGLLAKGKATKWRTAGPAVTIETVGND